MDNQKNVNCEEALLLMSRHLDGDLHQGEIGQIQHHAINCGECQKQMEAMSAIELELAAYSEYYNTYSLNDQFNAKIKTALAQQAPSAPPLSLWQQLNEKFASLQSLTESRFFPMGVGTLASFLIFAIVWPQLQTNQTPDQSPITLLEVPFEQAQQANWNHEKTIPPGQSVQILVQQGDGKSYLLRMSSSGPVKMNFRHGDQKIQQVYSQNMILNGLLYATLKASKHKEGVMIHNDGNVPIKLNAHSHQPQAIQMILKNRAFR